jgi:hypothetical protein
MGNRGARAQLIIADFRFLQERTQQHLTVSCSALADLSCLELPSPSLTMHCSISSVRFCAAHTIVSNRHSHRYQPEDHTRYG